MPGASFFQFLLLISYRVAPRILLPLHPDPKCLFSPTAFNREPRVFKQSLSTHALPSSTACFLASRVVPPQCLRPYYIVAPFVVMSPIYLRYWPILWEIPIVRR